MLKDAARQLGPKSKAHKQLHDTVDCPRESQLLWAIYCKLSPDFTLVELKAYDDLTGYNLSPNQVDLLIDIHKASYD